MTTHQKNIRPSDEEWAATYMATERRRQLAIGIAVIAAAALVTLMIILGFANAAAIAW